MKYGFHIQKPTSSILAAIFLGLASPGCTHTQRNCSPQYLNEELRGRQMSINTLAGPVRGAEEILTTADSTSWRDSLGIQRSIGNSSILDFEKRSPGIGALEGLFFGVLGGTAVGWVKGYSEGDDTEGYVSFTAEDKAKMWGFIGALSGGVIGAIIGVVIGSRHVYRFGAVTGGSAK